MFTEMNTSGAGLVDALSEMAGVIGDENSSGLDGATGIGNVLIEGLGAIANPLDALATSAISWIIDHISILRWPLDITIGDPRVVASTITTLNDTALALDRLASEQSSAITREVPTYVSGTTRSSIAFSNHMQFRATQLSGASLACAGAAQAIAMGGTRIAAVRSAIRDLIAEYVWNLLELAARRLPAGFLTAGAAIADFCARAMSWAAKLIDKVGSMLRGLLDALADIGKQIKQIATTVTKLLSPVLSGTKWVPSPGLALRASAGWVTEAAKADSAERATSGQSAAGRERVGQMHAEEDDHNFSWSNAAIGAHTITAKATDNSNNTTTSTAVNITVAANTPPTVALTAPANGAQFTSGATITITATASDANGPNRSLA